MAVALDIVVLDVGGTPYKTTRSTLTKRSGTMLARMFSDANAATLRREPDGSVFLDADGRAFAHVLSALRYDLAVDADAPPEAGITANEWRAVVDYFQLTPPAEEASASAAVKRRRIEEPSAVTAELEEHRDQTVRALFAWLRSSTAFAEFKNDCVTSVWTIHLPAVKATMGDALARSATDAAACFVVPVVCIQKWLNELVGLAQMNEVSRGRDESHKRLQRVTGCKWTMGDGPYDRTRVGWPADSFVSGWMPTTGTTVKIAWVSIDFAPPAAGT